MKIDVELSNEILEINKKIEKDLDLRLEEYKRCFSYCEEDFFLELAFCILTPQSKAVNAWEAIESLKKNKLIYNGSEEEIVKFLNKVRFKNTKAKRLVKLREMFTVDGKLKTKEILFKNNDVFEIRKYLVKNALGIGMKEASHFLRNIGFGSEIAILDRHILRVLLKLKVIEYVPKTITEKSYVEIESKMREFSKLIGIPMDRLDLVLWYRQVGYIFK